MNHFKELIEQCWEQDPSKRPTFDEIFDKLATNKYFLDGIDVNEFKLYVDDITEITDQTDKLLVEIAKLNKESQQFKEENQRLKEENQQLKEESQQFKEENQQLKVGNKLYHSKDYTFIKIAFLFQARYSYLSKKFKEDYEELIYYIKNTFTPTIEKSVLGNETVTINQEIKNFMKNNFIGKKEINLLQNTFDIHKIDLEAIKKEVFEVFRDDEINKKNWVFILSHEDIFMKLEDQIRNDIKNNEIEMIIVKQTLIANKYFEKYKELKANISPENQKQVFTYHGTPLRNHQSIIIKHFLMPGQDKMMFDYEYYGEGIATTDNIFYASMYSNSYHLLKYNEKTSLLACLSIFKESYTKHISCLSSQSKKIDQNITDHYGINYFFSGSSNNFHPIPESDKDKNFI